MELRLSVYNTGSAVPTVVLMRLSAAPSQDNNSSGFMDLKVTFRLFFRE